MFFAAAILGVGSCKNNSVDNGKPIITVSIEPQRWLLEHIVGNRMEVRTLLARGGNPESYEPSFSHMTDLEQSSLYMQLGNLGFENALKDRMATNFPDLPIVSVSDSIALISGNHGHDHGVDPHVWSSAANARIIAKNMLRAVTGLDPEDAGYYRDNYDKLIAKIDSVDKACAQMLAPFEGKSFMVWHPSLSYFARDYGLHQISIGVEGKEHSVPDTRTVLNQVDKAAPVVFFVQQDFDKSKAAGVINNEKGLRVESINPLNYEWDAELLFTAKAIAGR